MADPERIWLEPPPGAPDTGRLWCKDDVWSADPAYAQDGPATAYVRADLHETLRAKVRALSAPLPSDPDGRMWSTLGYFANREGDDLDTEVMAWAMSAITGLRTRVAELEAALRSCRGALRLDAMVDDDGKPFGTTAEALEAARRALEPADGR